MAFVAIPSIAQITEGEPRATVLPTGNRLQKGVWGVFIGGAATWDKKDAEFNDSKFHVSPLVNVKYMVTDRIETRLGFEFGKTKDRWAGTRDNGSDGEVKDSYKEVNSHILFNPGAAYHFSKNNLLDVYVGAEIPFGWERQTVKKFVEDRENGSTYSPKFNVGCGAFIGLQAFIGRLPLALGLEYGFQSLFSLGRDKVKTKSTTEDGGEQIVYNCTSKNSDNSYKFPGSYNSMSARHGEIRSQVRLTLSYYFNR